MKLIKDKIIKLFASKSWSDVRIGLELLSTYSDKELLEEFFEMTSNVTAISDCLNSSISYTVAFREREFKDENGRIKFYVSYSGNVYFYPKIKTK